jgi:acyl carrier protein
MSPVEGLIAGVWQQALHVDDVGAYDSFLDLGGHSLLAMEVIAKLEELLGVRISPRELMFQTLGQLAATCQERKQQNQLPAMNRWLRRAIDSIAQVFSSTGATR